MLMCAVCRKSAGRIRKMGGGLSITQSGERNLTTLGRRFGRVDSEAVERTPLLHLDFREQSVRLGQFTRFDGFLRISFQGSDFRIVPRLSRCRCLKVLE